MSWSLSADYYLSFGLFSNQINLYLLLSVQLHCIFPWKMENKIFQMMVWIGVVKTEVAEVKGKILGIDSDLPGELQV